MKLTNMTIGIPVLCLCLAVAFTAMGDQIAKGDKALRAGDTNKAITAYQNALNSRNADVREDAIDRLARVGGPEATQALALVGTQADLPALEAAANDGDMEVRMAVQQAITQAKTRPAPPPPAPPVVEGETPADEEAPDDKPDPVADPAQTEESR